jgi:hypothetical protein
VFASLRATGRNELIGEVYTEYGRRFHQDGRSADLAQLRQLLVDVGASDVAGAADDDSWDVDVETSTKEATELAGPDVGSPVLVFDEPRRAVFGPIVSPPPRGDEAAQLLELVVAAARTPGFYELKRGRSGPPQFGPRP